MQPIADHRRPPGHHLTETLAGLLGPMLLDEGEDPVEDDHTEDGDAQFRQLGDEGEPTGNPQQNGEEVDELGQELSPDGRPGQDRESVGAE